MCARHVTGIQLPTCDWHTAAVRLVPLNAIKLHAVAAGHRGGLYVFTSIQQCLQRDEQSFPQECALLSAPRAIAQVLAW